MNDETELKNANRYFWCDGCFKCSAVTASVMTVVGLIVWVAW